MGRLIIGISGHAGSGKDTVANCIQRISKRYVEIHRFGDELKRQIGREHPLVWCTRTWENGDRKYRDEFVPELGMTRRKYIQWYGQDKKSKHGLMYWVDSLFDTIGKSTNLGEFFVVSDVRFKYEAEAIKDAGGLLFRVEVPHDDIINPDKDISEIDLDGYQGFDDIIINDSTVHVLYDKISALLKKHGIK